MDALELNAIAHNGTVTVNLPDLYRQAWDEQPLRVILLKDDPSQAPTNVSLLAKLRQIKIAGPADFSENIDAYLTGEKNA